MHLRLLRRHGEVRFLPFVSFGFLHGFVRLRFGLGWGIFVRVFREQLSSRVEDYCFLFHMFVLVLLNFS